MAAHPPIPPEPDDDDFDDIILDGRPPTRGEEILTERFYEQLAGQSKLMDELARQMITVEMAVPGVFAAALALLRGKDATLPAGPLLWLAFGGWLGALALTFAALFPRRYAVDPDLLRGDPDTPTADGRPPTADAAPLDLETFYRKSARDKYVLLLLAALLFATGVVAAVCLLLG